MANVINATSTGNGGLITTGDDSGILNIQTNETTALSIDASQNLAFNSGYGSVATAYGCRAWVNFNGTGTVAIRASGNVSSITDHGTGEYTINFTTAMPDANYSYSLSTRNQSGNCRGIVVGSSTTTPQTGSFRIENYDLYLGSLSLKDVDYICVSISR
jgi:hypothetical protein